MKGWKECKLSDAVKFGNGKVRPNSDGTIPVYGGNGILGFGNESNYKDETIVIGRVGAYCGAVYFENKPIWVSDNALSAKPTDISDAKFIFYYLKNLGLNQFAEGSSHPLVTQKLLNSIDIIIPSTLPEQKAIAAVLSSLDDKIDLLHRQNKTLEAMAETLFRQWFVEEADEGWEEGSLLNLIELIGGGTPKTNNPEYWDGGIPWLAGGDISSNHKSFIQTAQKTISELGLNNSSAKLLPKYSTVISARGTVGKYCLLSEPMAFSQSNYGIVPRIDNCFFFTYLLINYVVEELQSSAYGSVFDTITTNTFRDLKIGIPTESTVRKFEATVVPYFDKLLQNKTQIRTLEKLRDTLLPKLMSGEIRVKI